MPKRQALCVSPYEEHPGLKQTFSCFQWTKSLLIFTARCYAGPSSWPWCSGLGSRCEIETPLSSGECFCSPSISLASQPLPSPRLPPLPVSVASFPGLDTLLLRPLCCLFRLIALNSSCSSGLAPGGGVYCFQLLRSHVGIPPS